MDLGILGDRPFAAPRPKCWTCQGLTTPCSTPAGPPRRRVAGRRSHGARPQHLVVRTLIVRHRWHLSLGRHSPGVGSVRLGGFWPVRAERGACARPARSRSGQGEHRADRARVAVRTRPRMRHSLPRAARATEDRRDRNHGPHRRPDQAPGLRLPLVRDLRRSRRPPTTTARSGVELKRLIKDDWWRTVVRDREDVVGLDASILMAARVWEVSGHVDGLQRPAGRLQELQGPLPRRPAWTRRAAPRSPRRSPASAAASSPSRASSTSCSSTQVGRRRGRRRRRSTCARRPRRASSSTSRT